ncbi:hypothetical protein FJZ18_01150 [Candidatus Pacearchaeota archaeon]|nr:hypothetical protein [Candidatus Pacearchaeota archaeon]
MEEVSHIIHVLEDAKQALLKKDGTKLSQLSNQTIHCASSEQDASSIMIAVLVYSMSKIVERKDLHRIRNYDLVVKKFIGYLDLALLALKEGNLEAYEGHLQRARIALTSTSLNIKPFIQDVLRKASINKASKIYEHGISMGRTAALLGVTQWELSEYTGQKEVLERNYVSTQDVRSRAEMALRFFS